MAIKTTATVIRMKIIIIEIGIQNENRRKRMTFHARKLTIIQVKDIAKS